MKRYLYVLLVVVLMSIPSIYASSILENDLAGMKKYLVSSPLAYPYDVYVYRYPWFLYLNGSGYIDVFVDNIYSVDGSSIINGYVVKNNSVIGLEVGIYIFTNDTSLGKLFDIGFIKYVNESDVNKSYNVFTISMVFDRSGNEGIVGYYFEYNVSIVRNNSVVYEYNNITHYPYLVCAYAPCYPFAVAMYIVFANNSVYLYHSLFFPEPVEVHGGIEFHRVIVVHPNITLSVDPSLVLGGSIHHIKLLDGFKGYISHIAIGETSLDRLIETFKCKFCTGPTILGSWGEVMVFPQSNLTIVVDPMYSVYSEYSGRIVFYNPWYPTSYDSIAYVNASNAQYSILNGSCGYCFIHKLYVFRNNPFVKRYGENIVVFRYFPVSIVKFVGTGEEIVVLGNEYVWYPTYLPNQIQIYFPVQYINLPYRHEDYTYTTSTTTITQTIFIKTSTPATSPSPTPTGFDWSFILLLALLAVFGLGIAFALRR